VLVFRKKIWDTVSFSKEGSAYGNRSLENWHFPYTLKGVALSYSEQHPVISIKNRCKPDGPLLADVTLAVLHFGNITPRNTGQIGKLFLCQPFGKSLDVSSVNRPCGD